MRLRFHIGPLDRREMREYIDHRLAVAGREPNDLFSDETFDIIYRYTGGVPRLINTLCDTTLLCAFADEKDSVGVDELMAAVAELDWQEQDSKSGLHRMPQEPVTSQAPADHVTRIEVRANGETLSAHSLPPGRAIVGRSSDNEIFIKSKFVSRRHAQLVSDEKGCLIEDLNSTNGVFLGENQVKVHRLRDGDVVSLGVHELVYTDLRKDSVADATGDDGVPEPDAEGEPSAVSS